MEPLHVAEFGVFLGKHSERVVVRKGRETVSEHPLIHVEQILVSGRGVSFSSDLVEECCARGIPITLLTPGGKPYGRLASPALTATVQTRREQIAAFLDERGARLARSMALAKLRNQANLLRYFAKYRKEADPAAYADLTAHAHQILLLERELKALSGGTADELRAELLNLEGRAGAHYWAGVSCLLRDKAQFHTRQHRGAADPVNAALNYGYGILQSQVWSALTLAGLEPFAGFIHVDRPGKPSLVLDLMEEFRQPVVDRALLAAWGRGWSLEMETESGDEAERVFLTSDSRRAVAERVRQRLETEVTHDGKHRPLKNVIQLQARRLARAVRAETEYRGYVGGW